MKLLDGLNKNLAQTNLDILGDLFNVRISSWHLQVSMFWFQYLERAAVRADGSRIEHNFEWRTHAEGNFGVPASIDQGLLIHQQERGIHPAPADRGRSEGDHSTFEGRKSGLLHEQLFFRGAEADPWFWKGVPSAVHFPTGPVCRWSRKNRSPGRAHAQMMLAPFCDRPDARTERFIGRFYPTLAPTTRRVESSAVHFREDYKRSTSADGGAEPDRPRKALLLGTHPGTLVDAIYVLENALQAGDLPPPHERAVESSIDRVPWTVDHHSILSYHKEFYPHMQTKSSKLLQILGSVHDHSNGQWKTARELHRGMDEALEPAFREWFAEEYGNTYLRFYDKDRVGVF